MVKSKTLYLADDDYDDRMLLIDAIKSIDPSIEIIEAEDGKELLEILQSEVPTEESLIILDVNMPKMNGLETLARLRDIPDLAAIPAVMVSTSSKSELMESAKKLGAANYFLKPTKINELLQLAKQLIFGLSGTMPT
ncbi:response regulator [Dyadobacter sediminis]|uniref:Response regulator n=1 Tax=Dyadobacter sediminis TaxID=1493691 RepID=A0A5R9KBM9_9BACT|nr:response regulator [Dyadobacter sediminis]TLU92230.1 response regulator [Dyadobacter sediminis]GGB96345.1 response regulator [Dyadobacter sediminis]